MTTTTTRSPTTTVRPLPTPRPAPRPATSPPAFASETDVIEVERARALLTRLLAIRRARREQAARQARAEQEAIMQRTLLVTGLLHR